MIPESRNSTFWTRIYKNGTRIDKKLTRRGKKWPGGEKSWRGGEKVDEAGKKLSADPIFINLDEKTHFLDPNSRFSPADLYFYKSHGRGEEFVTSAPGRGEGSPPPYIYIYILFRDRRGGDPRLGFRGWRGGVRGRIVETVQACGPRRP